MRRSVGFAILGSSALKDTLAAFVPYPDNHFRRAPIYRAPHSHSSSASRERSFRKLFHQQNDGDQPRHDHKVSSDSAAEDTSRRNIVTALPFSLFLTSVSPQPASANLVQFPCEDGTLMNTYHFMRAGESLLEEEDMWGSNPLFLTNRENALSERGMQQVSSACDEMLERDFNPSVVLFSLAANCIDTANSIATEMKIGRNRVMPEYTNLDARGLGKWDMNARSVIEPAVWAMDATEAGMEGRNGRPPPNDDGTPNETLYNQVTRLRQLMSVCETNFSGDTVLLIFPDGTGPALLSCLIGGVPLRRVHELEYKSGEVRQVDKKRTLELLNSGPSQAYLQTIEEGKAQLKALRDNPDLAINVKDKQINDDMQAAEEARLAAQQAAKERELATWEKRQALERERRERNAKLEVERQTRKEKLEAERQTRNEALGTSKLPDFVSVAALGIVASMASIGTRQVAEKDTNASVDYPSPDGSTDKIWEEGNQSAAPSESATTGKALLDEDKDDDDEALSSTSSLAPELRVMEDLVENAPIDIPEFSSVKPFQDALDEEKWNARNIEESEEHRKQLADAAMEEYMNRDDGGEAWLDMMSGLMMEDEE